jgi:glycine reductase
MAEDNPAVGIYQKTVFIVPSGDSAAGMGKVMPKIARLALKLVREGSLGPALAEGYIPTGHRYNEYDDKTAAERLVAMIHKKLRGEAFTTEIPLRGFDVVPPAPPLEDLRSLTVALVTGGGIVPKGNPDRLKQAFSTTYASYRLDCQERLEPGYYEGIHGGFDCLWANEDPNRVVPVDVMRDLEREGVLGRLFERFFVTVGIGTNVANAKRIGEGIAQELNSAGVSAAIFTST